MAEEIIGLIRVNVHDGRFDQVSQQDASKRALGMERTILSEPEWSPRLLSACHATEVYMRDSLDPTPIIDLAVGFWGAKTLLSAVEIDLFTALAPSPLDRETLATRLQLHPRAVRDFLDALVALGMLARTGDMYANTPETEAFLVRGKPEYVGDYLDMLNTRLYPFWGALAEALRTGKPQNEAKHGGDLFGAIYGTPDLLRGFVQSVTGLTFATARAIARQFPWASYRTFIDLGTAQGALPVQVALAHPHITGGGFDLPAVQPHFDTYVKGFGLAERLRFFPGDFFTDPLPIADVFAMGRVLHDWDLATKRQLIAKVFDALPPGGAFLVHEALIDDDRRQHAYGLLMSLTMLIDTHGGFDFTGAECTTWMREAGFKETRIEPLAGHDAMIVGIK
jgi:hypothetical protein